MSTTQTDQRATALGYIGYLLIGTAAVLVPSVMPPIRAEFMAMGVGLAVIGLIVPAGAIGGIVGNLLAGIGSDVVGRRWLVWLSAFALAAALVFAALAHPWAVFVAGFIGVSMAQASLATGINAMIADANRGARARALNALHGIYGVGAALSPLVIGSLLERGLPWRWILAGVGLVWLTYGLAIFVLNHNQSRLPQDRLDGQIPTPRQKLNLQLLRDGSLLPLFLIAFLYNGIAVSLLTWIAVYMQQSAGLSIFLSVSMVSVFYVGLTVGRFICAAVAERFKYATILLMLAIGIALTYPLVVLGGSPPVVAGGVFLTGLTLSGLFPMVLAYGSRQYPEHAGTLSGTLSVALTFGSLAPPLWTGVVAGLWGLHAALSVDYFMAIPLVLLALHLGRLEGRQMGATSTARPAK
jgi:fucose permease